MTEVDTLAHLDPHRVPLPNGTEVSTTTTRVHPGTGRKIPQGAVGRVVTSDGERVTVKLVGVGTVVYRRRELAPRKRGGLEYALQRAAHEAALGPCTILEATVGSRAWGLADEESDTDKRGVFLLPFPWTTGLARAPEVVVSADGSATFWELERAIRQALRADPNTLETLFVEEIETHGPVGADLVENRAAFVSAKIYGAFGRYGLAQAKKLEQSLRLAEHRSLVVDWLRERPETSLDVVAARLAGEALPADDSNAVHQARQYLKQLYRSMHDQGLLEASSFEALVAFAGDRAARFELPRELRPKNAYNLLRIVSCAVHWLETGEPLIRPEPGELRDRLLAIKAGEVPLRQALAWTDEMAGRLEAARSASVLPSEPDVARADELLRSGREWAARQWHSGTAGPWGADAAPAPPIASEGTSHE